MCIRDRAGAVVAHAGSIGEDGGMLTSLLRQSGVDISRIRAADCPCLLYTSPPVGPALGQHGVNIMAFTKEFNERTKNEAGMIIPVIITVYADRSFTFVTKTPPAAVLIKKACGIEKASGVPNKTKVCLLYTSKGRTPQGEGFLVGNNDSVFLSGTACKTGEIATRGSF